jgi:hypothetical protein
LYPAVLAVGVGKNEESIPPVRRPRLFSAEQVPFRIEPEAGKVGQHVTQAACPEPWHVFNEHVGGTQGADDSSELGPNPAFVAGPASFAGETVWLAWESAANNVNASCCLIDIPHIGVAANGRPVMSKYSECVRVAFGLPSDLGAWVGHL